MDNSSPKVYFVVVNWNQCALTLECLYSLQQQEYSNFAVILVDNGSEDESVKRVQTQYPDTVIFENGRNLGIAAANNAGIRYALRLAADYVFLLNNDTVVHPQMLSHLVAVAESDATIGMAGPTMFYFDEPEVIWCAGNSINWKNGSTKRLQDSAPTDTDEALTHNVVDFITSCAVCIKSEVFKQTGLMDERYFIYYDETDWFARASKYGWRAVHVPQAKMWHKVSATMGESSPRTDYYMVRNKFLFLSKNLSGSQEMLALMRAAAQEVLTIAAYTFNSHNGARIPHRNARLFALGDAVRGKWGPMGTDVRKGIV